ncbi:hypothetical protein TGRUB_244420 [Toxoplasma gondii RUB]|uniref:rRNA biogenesis protein RRP36 n=10 Tax=Toxoplasma gondii TaxID=5811 RepID=S7VTV3_TOXGG|nr:hypothetical protein TGGT1_244420 [Toxoplasma gondii GT1]KAF4643140.1 hypothetical protein TGRH88_028070 [Toxoplasma gondii]KFG34436.1 hypothetical protein TGP89_244420 [Toxoplasma gondii p89]KFG36551.1 hypothetical protein TGDOM2_244420 [Toxoplasma gondii GAB2-2007-GAL-DOM2]KFG51603.1 hypothetical protein TGFOU_244420 [Toxoplasma gondii FOU]KFG60332.1 hypothetical protein TGRUB_244420 [Toxoplasma gondii RUB]KFH04622.1 hypothetical protein TGVAND_244420 [Toxoplasma gondii VAND]KFH14080.1 
MGAKKLRASSLEDARAVPLQQLKLLEAQFRREEQSAGRAQTAGVSARCSSDAPPESSSASFRDTTPSASSSSSRPLRAGPKAKGVKKVVKKSNKKSPLEVSSRRPQRTLCQPVGLPSTPQDAPPQHPLSATVPSSSSREAAMHMHMKRLRHLAIQGKKSCGEGRKARDPRFSEACGPLNLRMVSQAYAFLDDMRKAETDTLKAAVATGRSVEKNRPKLSAAEREAAKRELQKRQSQDEARLRRRVEMDIRQSVTKAERTKIAQTAKKPFFLGRRELRKLVSEEMHARRAGGAKRRAKVEERRHKKKLGAERKRDLVPVRRHAEAD